MTIIQFFNMITKELEEEAKRRYPIGTKFTPAHVDRPDCIFTVKGNYYSHLTGICADIEEDRVFVPNIYYEGKWADIIFCESGIINNYSII